MKITVEFANLDEFKQYMGIESPSALAQATQGAEAAPAPVSAEPVQEPAPEPADEPAPAEEEEGAPAVTEEFRITVRKQLAALNKKCGRNRAAELISQLTGKSKFTEVDLADLPKLMEAAKEETNAD